MIPRITDPRRHCNRFRDVATVTILEEAECWLWDLAEIDADPHSWEYPAQSRAFVIAKIEDANQELARRDRLRHRPGAPPWPERWPDRREELTTIKQAIDLPRFIEEMAQVRLEPRGRNLVGRCPLPGHDDRSPSFTVYPDGRGWWCFGCGKGGDVFSFSMFMLQTDRFGEVVDALAIEAGIARTGKERTNVG